MCAKFITIVLSAMFITACGSSGGGGSSDAKTTTPAPASPGGSTPTVTMPNDPAIVVYTAQSTKSITTGGQTYTVTMTGYCTVYGGNTYCWDDGWHRPVASLGYDYWGFIESNGQMLQGSEGGADATDPMESTPTLITTAIVNQLPGNVIEPNGTEQTMVTQLLANGTQSTVNCTVDGSGNLDCPTFTIEVQ